MQMLPTLPRLLAKDKPYTWTAKHQKAFIKFKRCLQRPPILTYLAFSKPYLSFADASKYCCGATLCLHIQTRHHGWPETHNHHLWKFFNIECNYAAFVREAFAIYISVKTLSFYLHGCRVYHTVLS